MRGLQVLFLILLSALAQAAEKYEFYNGVRQLGMGGAGIAVANDETAVFINPAALGKLRDPFLTIVDPELHMSSAIGSYTSGFDFNLIGIENIAEKIRDNPDKHFHLKGQVFPSIVVPNFAAGVLIKYEMNGDFDSTDNEVDLDYVNDFTAVLGYNLRLFDGRLKVGFSGRYINRSIIKASDSIPVADIDGADAENLAQNGGGIALDAGVILTAPWATLPTLAVVVRDIGDTSFDLGAGFASGTGVKPDSVKQSVDAALAFFPIIGKRTRTTITFEMRDILSEDEDDTEDIYRLLHGGVELNISDVFFIRGGMNGRYWTAGLEFAIQNFQFQAASYGEEIGTAETTKEDRRYVFKFAYRY